MSALIISTLRDKRLEVADAIERLERQVDQHRADLAHLEATMRLFDPNVEPETFQPTPPRRRNDWFGPGDCRRRIHDVLRDAGGPMTTREIVEGVMAAKKLPEDDARTREIDSKNRARLVEPGDRYDRTRRRGGERGLAGHLGGCRPLPITAKID